MARNWMISLGLCLIPSSAVFAADEVNVKPEQADQSILMDAEQLQERPGDQALRILDTRAKEEFERGHLPGAIHVDVAEWKALVASPNGLHDTTRWAKTIGELGLETKDAHVVVYGDKHSNTARVWWLLKYVGVSNVSILDGGWPYWVKTGGATETTVSTVSATPFEPNFQQERLAEIDPLKKSLGSVTVVDTRSSEEFAAGHIATATRLEWKTLIADDGRFKTKAELRQIFRESNILPADMAVCY